MTDPATDAADPAIEVADSSPSRPTRGWVTRRCVAAWDVLVDADPPRPCSSVRAGSRRWDDGARPDRARCGCAPSTTTDSSSDCSRRRASCSVCRPVRRSCCARRRRRGHRLPRSRVAAPSIVRPSLAPTSRRSSRSAAGTRWCSPASAEDTGWHELIARRPSTPACGQPTRRRGRVSAVDLAGGRTTRTSPGCRDGCVRRCSARHASSRVTSALRGVHLRAGRDDRRHRGLPRAGRAA
jgi:hypothetical protein